MTAIRKEIVEYINNLSESKLEALKPLLLLLLDETICVETDLSEEEKAIIKAGREEYKKGGFVSLESI